MFFSFSWNIFALISSRISYRMFWLFGSSFRSASASSAWVFSSMIPLSICSYSASACFRAFLSRLEESTFLISNSSLIRSISSFLLLATESMYSEFCYNFSNSNFFLTISSILWSLSTFHIILWWDLSSSASFCCYSFNLMILSLSILSNSLSYCLSLSICSTLSINFFSFSYKSYSCFYSNLNLAYAIFSYCYLMTPSMLLIWSISFRSSTFISIRFNG